MRQRTIDGDAIRKEDSQSINHYHLIRKNNQQHGAHRNVFFSKKNVIHKDDLSMASTTWMAPDAANMFWNLLLGGSSQLATRCTWDIRCRSRA